MSQKFWKLLSLCLSLTSLSYYNGIGVSYIDIKRKIGNDLNLNEKSPFQISI